MEAVSRSAQELEPQLAQLKLAARQELDLKVLEKNRRRKEAINQLTKWNVDTSNQPTVIPGHSLHNTRTHPYVIEVLHW